MSRARCCTVFSVRLESVPLAPHGPFFTWGYYSRLGSCSAPAEVHMRPCMCTPACVRLHARVDIALPALTLTPLAPPALTLTPACVRLRARVDVAPRAALVPPRLTRPLPRLAALVVTATEAAHYDARPFAILVHVTPLRGRRRGRGSGARPRRLLNGMLASTAGQRSEVRG